MGTDQTQGPDACPLAGREVKVGFEQLVFKTLGTRFTHASSKVPAAEESFANGYGITVQQFGYTQRKEYFCQVGLVTGRGFIPLMDERYYPEHLVEPYFSGSYGSRELVEKVLEKVQGLSPIVEL